jgi:hypothetical protein
MKKLLLSILIFSLVWTPFVSSALTPEEEKGTEIVREMDKRDTGFGDFTADMLMILKNKNGDESEREIRTKTLEVDDDGDKNLMIFDSPKDVQGSAFLSFTHKEGDDDQWLFLPALKRVKRISSRNQSGSFMGSEFSYEDITSQEIEKYTYKWIKDEVYEEKECFVIERYPVNKKYSGYTRQMVWIDKSEYRVWKIDFYDRKDSLLKTLTFEEYEQFLDQYWRAHKMNMVNHQNEKSSLLIMSNFEFQTGLEDEDFNTNSLKRAK